MSTFTNNNVASGDVVRASDHNTQGANIAAVVNGNIENDNIDASAAIASSKIAGLNATAFSAWQDWTPTFANFTKDTATIVAKYIQIGKTVHFRLSVVLDSSVMGSAPTFSLPVTSATYGGSSLIPPIGQVGILDSGSALYSGVALWTTTTTATLRVSSAGSTYVSPVGISATVPMTWADGDEFHVEGTYEAA